MKCYLRVAASNVDHVSPGEYLVRVWTPRGWSQTVGVSADFALKDAFNIQVGWDINQIHEISSDLRGVAIELIPCSTEGLQ